MLSVDLQRGDVTIAEQPPTEAEDRRILMQGLEGIASMSRGSLSHIAGTGEPIFERLARRSPRIYLLGVEQKPSDSNGDRHRIDVEVRRSNVTIRSRQAFVLSPSRTVQAIAEENLRDALVLAICHLRPAVARDDVRAAGPGKRQGANRGGCAGRRVRRKPGNFAIGYLVIDDQNRVAASFGDQVSLRTGAGSANEPLKFVGGVLVEPGIYRFASARWTQEGRRGSVMRDVSAWKMAGEAFAFGDLIVGGMPTTGQGLTVPGGAVRAHRRCRSLPRDVLRRPSQTWNGTTVTFEVADDPGRARRWRRFR